jgi:hypothetical protein
MRLCKTFVASLLILTFSSFSFAAQDNKEFYTWVGRNYECSYFKQADGTTRYQTVTIPACEKESAKSLCIASLDCRKKKESTAKAVTKLEVNIICNGPPDSCPDAATCLSDSVAGINTYYEISEEATSESRPAKFR